MKKKFIDEIKIPEGVQCSFEHHVLVCKKSGNELKRDFKMRDCELSINGDKIIMKSDRADRKTIASIRAFMAHVQNMFRGLDNKFVYELEICNVHFPTTVKVEGNKLTIANFLGEKEKRVAHILPHVDVEIKGQKITVASHNLESAGQTAANMEKATKILKRDRRVFQDGIFITSKCGVPI